MSAHLVIIDALNLIRRIHSAQPDPSDIQRTIQTSQRTLDRIIAEANPTHMVAVFDHHETGNLAKQNRGWRSELLPEYKQDRKPMPDPLAKGLDSIQEAWWQSYQLDSVLSEGDEADDLIATLAEKVTAAQSKATIISTDKGYCQLLQPNLFIRDYFQHRWLDFEFVSNEFHVRPDQLTDYWGIAGISSSKIPGIPGLGPKAAQEILNLYPNIEAANADPELLPKYRKKFDAHFESAQICKKIARLDTQMQLGFNLKDLRFSPTAS